MAHLRVVLPALVGLGLDLVACGGSGAPPGVAPLNPHPVAWATNTAAGVTGFHGAAALQQTGCVECHAPGSAQLLCDLCHRSDGPGLPGMGGSLHPAGYGAAHPRSEIAGNTLVDIGGGIALPCLACHKGG
jgi:hypothetical protein